VNCTGAPLALALERARNRSWPAQGQEQERCSSVQEPVLVAQQRRWEWILGVTVFDVKIVPD
jgi:hypothetical protein